MKIAINNSLLLKHYSVEESLKLLKDAGFDGVDLSIHKMMQEKYDIPVRWNGDHYLEEARKLGAYAKELGLSIVQAHGYVLDRHDDFEEVSFPRICRSIEIAAAAGAPYILIPALSRGVYRGNEEAFFTSNMEFYGRLAPIAEKCGIKIALENTIAFDWAHFVQNHHVCSQPEEFCKYIDTLNAQYGDLFVACANLARMPLVGKEAEELLQTVGDRVKLIHVSDNDYRKDNQTVPGYGALDFDRISAALKAADFKGYYTLTITSTLPKELLPSGIAHMAAIARYWADQAEG